MALEGVPMEGIILLKDTPLCNTELIAVSLLRTTNVFAVLTVAGRSKTLRRRYSRMNEAATFVSFSTESTVDGLFSELSKHSVIFVDCLELLVEFFGANAVTSLLYKSKASGKCLIACCPARATITWQRLASVADATFILSCSDGTVFSDAVIYKKSGKVHKVTEIVTVKDMKVSSKKFVPSEEIPTKNNGTGLEMAFDSLKASEREARAALQLPYMSEKSIEGFVTLRQADKKVRVGGQVIYTPDEGDDLDDSDPDDDLNL